MAVRTASASASVSASASASGAESGLGQHLFDSSYAGYQQFVFSQQHWSAAVDPIRYAFKAFEHDWSLWVHPYGSESSGSGSADALAHKEYVSIFLTQDSVGSSSVSFALLIKNLDNLENDVFASSQPHQFDHSDADSMDVDCGDKKRWSYGFERFVPRRALTDGTEFCRSDVVTFGLALKVWPQFIEEQRLLHVLKVLLVEDSVCQQKILVRRLALAGSDWSIECVNSAELAIDVIGKKASRGESYDVVLVDQNLAIKGHELNGSELVHILRIRCRMLDTVIVGCSTNVKKHARSLLQAGCDTVWPKPLPPIEEMKEYLATALLRTQTLRRNSSSSPNFEAAAVAKAAAALAASGYGGCSDSFKAQFVANKEVVHSLSFKAASDSITATPDVVVVSAEGDRHLAHRLFLVSCSEVFATMLLQRPVYITARSARAATPPLTLSTSPSTSGGISITISAPHPMPPSGSRPTSVRQSPLGSTRTMTMSPGPTTSHDTTYDQLPELFLEGVDKNMADEIVRFAYTGDIRASILIARGEELLEVGRKYHIWGLVEICSAFLAKEVESPKKKANTCEF